jgi:hypothetical protein
MGAARAGRHPCDRVRAGCEDAAVGGVASKARRVGRAARPEQGTSGVEGYSGVASGCGRSDE